MIGTNDASPTFSFIVGATLNARVFSDDLATINDV
jgi:hypothetical protein